MSQGISLRIGTWKYIGGCNRQQSQRKYQNHHVLKQETQLFFLLYGGGGFFSFAFCSSFFSGKVGPSCALLHHRGLIGGQGVG